MTRKKIIKTALIFALVFLALGGWCLHLRIHPPSKDEDNLIPFLSGIFSVFCLPFLFCYRRTLTSAYGGYRCLVGEIRVREGLVRFGIFKV